MVFVMQSLATLGLIVIFVFIKVASQTTGEKSSDDDSFGTQFKLIKSLDIYSSYARNASFEEKYKTFLEENPNEIELKSENYPNPYPNLVSSYKNYTISDGAGVKITIHDLDLDPKKDFIYIRPGTSDETHKKGPTLTGSVKEPLRFLIPGSNVFSLQFVSQHNENDTNNYKGYLITYSSFGEVLTTTVPSTTTESIVPQEKLQWTRKEVIIKREDQKESLPKIKEALTNATNLYIAQYNLSFYECNQTNIYIKTRKCPETWPRAVDCVNLEFSIPLKFKPIEIDDDEDETLNQKIATTKSTIPTFEMTTKSLNKMWNEFGLKILAEKDIYPYMVPNSFSILLIWISVSIAILGAFIFILYSIWKLDIFKDYRRLSHFGKWRNEDDKDALKKNEFDISMIPSPHQIVPSLFPIAEHPAEHQGNSFENPSFRGESRASRTFEQLTPIVNFNDTSNRNNPFTSDDNDR